MRYAPPIISLLLILSSTSIAQNAKRVSLGEMGFEGNDNSDICASSLSTDGQFLAFDSFATNLVALDYNRHADVFVRDLEQNTTVRVSLNSSGVEGSMASTAPSISGDGRFIAFQSYADNLIINDQNFDEDVFVHDRQSGQTECISVGMFGRTGNGRSWSPVISADGHYVCFVSRASDLVSADGNWNADVFVYDRWNGSMERISIDSNGVEANSFSESASMSADGRVIAFCSHASNLVVEDSNSRKDIFVHDRLYGDTMRVSLSETGNQANDQSVEPSISADGKWISFTSFASNLHSLDTNGVSDIFLYDLENSSIDLVRRGAGDKISTYPSSNSTLSADGRFMVFQSGARNWASNDNNGVDDIYLYDRQLTTLERISVGEGDVEANWDCMRPSMNANASKVVYTTRADNLDDNNVDDDNNDKVDVYQYTRKNYTKVNSLILCGNYQAEVGDGLRFAWFGAPLETAFWFYRSRNLNGVQYQGHSFDLGHKLILVSQGAMTTNTTGGFEIASIPPAFAGKTLYFEFIVQDGRGGYLDSIVQEVHVML
jgi:Tol biopolymer transport system component